MRGWNWIAMGGLLTLSAACAPTLEVGGQDHEATIAPLAGCASLALSGPPIETYSALPGDREHRPVLQEDWSDYVMVTFGRYPHDASDPRTPLFHGDFDAWGDWDVEIEDLNLGEAGGLSFVTGETLELGYPLLFYNGVEPIAGPPYEDVLVASPDLDLVEPLATYSPHPSALTVTTSVKATPLFVARGATGALVGVDRPSGSTSHLAIVEATSEEPEGDAGTLDLSAACASSPIRAAALAQADGYLVAFSTGWPFGACDGGAAPGPPTAIHVAYRVPGGALSDATAITAGAPVRAFALVRRGQGAWLVWQEAPSAPLPSPPVFAVAVDGAGRRASDVFVAVAEGPTSGPLAAAGLGDDLAVAWVTATPGGSSKLELRVVGDATHASRAATAPGTVGPMTDGDLSLFGSPDGRRLVLAWLGTRDPSETEPRIQVARFDCGE